MRNRIRISKTLVEAGLLALRGRSINRHARYALALQNDTFRVGKPGKSAPSVALRIPDCRYDPLNLEISEGQPTHLNVLLPTIHPQKTFAGIATAITLAAKISNQGIPIRFIVTQASPDTHECEALKLRWSTLVDSSAPELHDIWDGSPTSQRRAVGRRDWFLATWWPTAWIAQETIKKLGFEGLRLAYFIQDYEPGFYPWSDHYALAAATYNFEAMRIVNTTYLARHLKVERGLDIDPELVLRPSLNATRIPTESKTISERKSRRIIMYGRPNSPRNLFGLSLTALDIFLSETAIGTDQLEIISAGEDHPAYRLSSGHVVRSAGKLPINDYLNLLRDSDIGLSLMLSPHPSYPPLEMAASGMLVVTNTYPGKSMRLSNNIIAKDPTPAAIAEGLSEAYEQVSDGERRLAGARLDLDTLGLDIAEVGANVARRLGCDRGIVTCH